MWLTSWLCCLRCSTGKNILTANRSRLGPALFEALVTLRHNSGLIARWVDGEEADVAAVALLAQELSSQAQDVVERNEVASAIRAVKL